MRTHLTKERRDSMSNEENVQVVKKFFAAIGSGASMPRVKAGGRNPKRNVRLEARRAREHIPLMVGMPLKPLEPPCGGSLGNF
jgi:hypothetical protein